MRLTTIRTRDFLALDELDLELDEKRTVITGQNNVGKSTVLAAVSLVMDAVAVGAGGDSRLLTSRWATSGHHGSERFQVRVGLTFDEPKERAILDQFLVGAWTSLLNPEGNEQLLLDAVAGALGSDPAIALTKGEIVVSYDGTVREAWTVAWEFDSGREHGHIRLLGAFSDHLTPGPATHEPPSQKLQGQLTATSTLDDRIERVRRGSVPLDLSTVLTQGSYPFVIDLYRMPTWPSDVRALASALGLPYDGNTHSIRFGTLLWSALSRGVVVTPNHRSAPRGEFTAAELHTESGRHDGSMLAAELHRLKNGGAAERALFARIQEIFEQLTGQHVDCVAENLAPGREDADGPRFLVTAVLTRTVESAAAKAPNEGLGAGGSSRGTAPSMRSYDIPLQRSGAGDSEALYLSHLLAQQRDVLLLDEPAVHLSPTAQRRLHGVLRDTAAPGQVVLVTHSPDMVPARDAQDLAGIVRLSRRAHGVHVDRLGQQLANDRSARTLMASSTIRAVLFAAGVVLVEGDTDLGLIEGWTSQPLRVNGRELPPRDSANIALLSVDGATNFPAHAGLLQALQIPFAILADGPALNPDSRPARGLAERGVNVPIGGKTLGDVRDAWEQSGVFTLADHFGDDGSKSGEIEAFLERVNAGAYKEVRQVTGARKGRVVGAAFASEVLAPEAFTQLWTRILDFLNHDVAPV
ncbi:AAA family ATPase [Terrabacter sp. NPDC080008]|uniref:AAA family ATPase n=1 Tax=Terrabacter sp. NPDC080008 TaxID=3155176 RepID=UPI00344EC49A